MMAYIGALCFPVVFQNPLISLWFIFPRCVPPRFPGVPEVIDFIGVSFSPMCPPLYPPTLRVRFGNGTRAWVACMVHVSHPSRAMFRKE